jgi:aldehyde:ferredoxin oxidoreductase
MSDRGGVHLYGTSISGQNDFAIADVMTLCIRHLRLIDPATMGQALKAATGYNFFNTRDEMDWFAQRIIVLERAWNLREGLVPDRDDILPERVFTEPLTLGPKAGTASALYDRDQFKKDKQSWYKLRGCDEHGIPTKKTLKDLELGFMINDLEKVVHLEES